MNRVVVDTNVIVSALIGKGNPRSVLELLFSDDNKFLELAVATQARYS